VIVENLSRSSIKGNRKTLPSMMVVITLKINFRKGAFTAGRKIFLR
jgi:hypothetical protein